MIREFAPDDDVEAAAVAALAQAAWPDDAFMREQHEDHAQAVHALVGLDAGEIVGVASISRNLLHPLRLSLVGAVAPAHRRSGIGSALLAALRSAYPDEIFRVRTRPDDTAGLEFLRACRFTPLMRNRIVTVDPARPDVIAWCAAQAVPVEYELTTDGLDPADVLDLCYAVYAQGHAWNPPDRFDENRRRQSFFASSDTLPAPLVAARIGGDLVGLVYGECEENDTHQLYVMPSGVLDLQRPGATEATAAMTGYVLGWALSHGRAVVFEIDDSEVHIAEVVATLPHVVQEQLLHLELRPQSARRVE